MKRVPKRATSPELGKSSVAKASAHKRLTWLLNFSECSKSRIESLSDEKLRRLRSKVWRFPERTMTEGSDDDLSRGRIAQLAVEIWTGLNALMKGEPWLPLIGPAKLYLRISNAKAERRYITTHADGFLLEAWELIATEAKRLRQCRWGRCQNLFVANKRQTFCSSACSQAQRTERFLAKHSKIELSAKRHARYVAQIRKKKGQAIAQKVRRRFARPG